jgi:hypothetical protein
MKKEKNHQAEADKKLAAVCGLYCEACSLYIATAEDPARLTAMACRFQMSEEEVKCYGCRSEKRGPYCRICKMFDCAAQKGIDFCVKCEAYPCEVLKEFQSAMPHRIELFKDLDRIGAIGWESWLKEIRENYTCHKCGTINSAYDLKCRKCGEEPGSDYAAVHKETIEMFLNSR